MGDVFCIQESFRAEKSLTRRHLSEYTHIEAELAFITFDDLLAHLEEMICRTIDHVWNDPEIRQHIQDLNKEANKEEKKRAAKEGKEPKLYEFQPPQRPFMRMSYADAIIWLNEHNIPNEDGEPHKFGDDIAEAAERLMTDKIDKPIFLTKFPVEIKAFYMKKDLEDPRVTESVDCLMPGVGEIVGGSMRMEDLDELMAAYKREGIPAAPYYWFTDQRKYVYYWPSLHFGTDSSPGTVPLLTVDTASVSSVSLRGCAVATLCANALCILDGPADAPHRFRQVLAFYSSTFLVIVSKLPSYAVKIYVYPHLSVYPNKSHKVSRYTSGTTSTPSFKISSSFITPLNTPNVPPNFPSIPNAISVFNRSPTMHVLFLSN